MTTKRIHFRIPATTETLLLKRASTSRNRAAIDSIVGYDLIMAQALEALRDVISPDLRYLILDGLNARGRDGLEFEFANGGVESVADAQVGISRIRLYIADTGESDEALEVLDEDLNWIQKSTQLSIALIDAVRQWYVAASINGELAPNQLFEKITLEDIKPGETK